MDDKTIFYIVGSALTLLAIVISFIGIRSKEFPPPGRVGRVMLAAFSALVLVTAAYAVLSAREEQAERREHLAEAEGEAEHAAEEESLQEAAAGRLGGDGGGEGGSEQGSDQAGAGQGEGGDELETQGAEVFAANGCASCHTLAAADATGSTGPNLDQSLQGRDDAYIEESIVDPDAEVAEGFQAGIMPAFDDLSEQDLNALVAFLKFSASMS